MSQTIAGAVAALVTKVSGLSGISYVPANPPEGIVQLPFGIVFPESLEFSGDYANQSKNLATLIVELHFSTQDLAIAVAKATPFGDSFPAAVAGDPSLGSAVMAVVFPLRAEFGTLKWGTEQHIGWKFHVTVKLENAV